MSVAGRTRRGPTVTSYHVQLSDGQESPSSPTRLNEDLQPRGAPPPRHGARHRQSARRARRRAAQPLCALSQESDTAMTVLLRRFQS